MPRKKARFKSEDGRKTLIVTVQPLSELTQQSGSNEPDVQAYQEEPEPDFIIDNGTKRLTITIAE